MKRTDINGPKFYGILYDQKTHRLTYLPTGRTIDLDESHYHWLKDYADDQEWASLEYILRGFSSVVPTECV